MRYFIDTEFYEDGKTIDLISIGIVAEDGREFYAVSQDARLDRVSPWMRENVLPHLPLYSDKVWMTRDAIRSQIETFIGLYTKPTAFWGYYSDYDWVVFCQLWRTMIDLPSTFPRFCMDLKQWAVMMGNIKLPPKPVDAHNALADARWNRDAYAFLDLEAKRLASIEAAAGLKFDGASR